MTDLTFYTHPMSRGGIARWMLEEGGGPSKEGGLAYGPEMRAPEFLAINPMGKVPVIVHNGAVMTDTVAICASLVDAFPEAELGPARDAALRGFAK